jgi:hypothetical protein
MAVWYALLKHQFTRTTGLLKASEPVPPTAPGRFRQIGEPNAFDRKRSVNQHDFGSLTAARIRPLNFRL